MANFFSEQAKRDFNDVRPINTPAAAPSPVVIPAPVPTSAAVSSFSAPAPAANSPTVASLIPTIISSVSSYISPTPNLQAFSPSPLQSPTAQPFSPSRFSSSSVASPAAVKISPTNPYIPPYNPPTPVSGASSIGGGMDALLVLSALGLVYCFCSVVAAYMSTSRGSFVEREQNRQDAADRGR